MHQVEREERWPESAAGEEASALVAMGTVELGRKTLRIRLGGEVVAELDRPAGQLCELCYRADQMLMPAASVTVIRCLSNRSPLPRPPSAPTRKCIRVRGNRLELAGTVAGPGARMSLAYDYTSISMNFAGVTTRIPSSRSSSVR